MAAEISVGDGGRALVLDGTALTATFYFDGVVETPIGVPTAATDAELEEHARADARIAELLEGVTVRKVIVVPGRLVNFVTA